MAGRADTGGADPRGGRRAPRRTAVVNTQTQPTSRSIADILRENIFTLFNGILTVCFIAVLVLGDLRDGFFYGVVVVNALIGIVQEVRAKLVLDRAALLAAPESRVRRDGAVVTVALEDGGPRRPARAASGRPDPGGCGRGGEHGLVARRVAADRRVRPGVQGRRATSSSPARTSSRGTGYARGDGGRRRLVREQADQPRSASTRSCTRSCATRPTASSSTCPGSSGPSSSSPLIGRVLTYGGFATLFVERPLAAGAARRGRGRGRDDPRGTGAAHEPRLRGRRDPAGRRARCSCRSSRRSRCSRASTCSASTRPGTLTTGELTLAFAPSRCRTGGMRCPGRIAEIALAAFGADDAGNATAGILSQPVPLATGTASSGASRSARRRSTARSWSRWTARESSWVLGAPERVLAEHPDALARANAIAATGQRTLALVRAVDPLPDGMHAPLDRASGVEPAHARRPRGDRAAGGARRRSATSAEQAVRVVVMSGDNPVTVAAIARALDLEGEAVDASTLDRRCGARRGAADVAHLRPGEPGAEARGGRRCSARRVARSR